MLTFAQFERELTSERTRDKMLQRAQQGLWNRPMHLTQVASTYCGRFDGIPHAHGHK
jgi:DNA invertase Pin-like site-specific DNA recombinase